MKWTMSSLICGIYMAVITTALFIWISFTNMSKCVECPAVHDVWDLSDSGGVGCLIHMMDDSQDYSEVLKQLS